MGGNRDKQRLIDSVYFTIRLNCRIILENGNYANFDSVKISFSLKNFAPPPNRLPRKKFFGCPPLKKILEKSQLLLLLLLFNIMLHCNTVKIF